MNDYLTADKNNETVDALVAKALLESDSEPEAFGLLILAAFLVVRKRLGVAEAISTMHAYADSVAECLPVMAVTTQ
jgi:hypothetical protein